MSYPPGDGSRRREPSPGGIKRKAGCRLGHPAKAHLHIDLIITVAVTVIIIRIGIVITAGIIFRLL